jgi:NDP-sugar pyrophosphorylase family protein
MLNIVIPMAGKGSRFADAGYAFPKPLIDINGKTMIEVVVDNLRPKDPDHRFIFICQREHYEKYDLYNVLKRATNDKFEVVQINGITEGAACTVLCAAQYISNDDELLIANSDQYIDISIDDFLADARAGQKDGLIMTFTATHPKWSYARPGQDGRVMEVAEKRVISDKATVGIYYYKHGKDYVDAAQAMIQKNIRHNNEFYVCPVYNELILESKNVYLYEIDAERMHGLGTPEDLNLYLDKIAKTS